MEEYTPVSKDWDLIVKCTELISHATKPEKTNYLIKTHMGFLDLIASLGIDEEATELKIPSCPRENNSKTSTYEPKSNMRKKNKR